MRLAFPEYDFNIKTQGQKKYILDKIRKKYVSLTPEEWVRQHVIEYLMTEKGYKKTLMSVELHLEINNMSRRCDIVVFNKNASPLMIVELKAPDVKLTQKTFNQIAMYNLKLKVNYLLISNGLQHFCCKLNHESNSYHFLESIPDYDELTD